MGIPPVMLLVLAVSARLCSSSGMVVIYWGTFDKEGSLKSACATGNYNIVVLSFLDTFGGKRAPRLDLADHCSNGNCTAVGEDAKFCQSKGVQVFLSLGGAEGNYGIGSKAEAVQVAEYLWNNFLGGSSKSRPLGDAVLDGIDFDIENGGREHYADLAEQLKQLGSKGGSKNKVLLSAAPQCPFPDEFMGPGTGSALGSGLFDYVWVQFYNNEDCHFHPNSRGGNIDNILRAWKKWASISAGKVLFGLPASLSAATDEPSTRDGFMPADIFIKQVLPQIKQSTKYGGVMLWSYYYDFVKRDGAKVPYSTAIKSHV